MFGFGVPELLIIGVILMMVFGVGKLPEVGSAFGKAISNFKRSANEKDLISDEQKKES